MTAIRFAPDLEAVFRYAAAYGQVTPEHLLAAIATVQPQALQTLEVVATGLLAEVGDLPHLAGEGLSPRTQLALTAAVAAARDQNAAQLTVRYLLLGLFAADAASTALLEEHGVTEEKLRADPNARLRQLLAEQGERLTGSERQVLALTFGLDSDSRLAPRRIAGRLGLPVEQVYRLRDSALWKLHDGGAGED